VRDEFKKKNLLDGISERIVALTWWTKMRMS